MPEGMVVKAFQKRRFGFIHACGNADASQDVFVHFKDVNPHREHGVSDKYLMVGEKVRYELKDGAKEGQVQATNVTVLNKRKSVRAIVVSKSGSHLRAQFKWEHHGLLISAVKLDKIKGTATKSAWQLDRGDELSAVAYESATGEVKLGCCIMVP